MKCKYCGNAIKSHGKYFTHISKASGRVAWEMCENHKANNYVTGRGNKATPDFEWEVVDSVLTKYDNEL